MAVGELTDEDRSLYAGVMAQIKMRVDQSYLFLRMGMTYFTVESAALQARFALELLALSSLVTHREAIAEVASAFAKKKPDEALRLARAANPHFWPEPTTQRFNDEGVVVEMVPVTDGYLTEEEWAPTWGRLSAWLHATNPFVSMQETTQAAHLVQETLNKIVVLLNHHQVQLLDRDHLLVCMLHEATTGEVQVFDFQYVGPAPGSDPGTA